MWLFGDGSSNAVSVVEQDDAVTGALSGVSSMIEVARGAEEIEEDFGVFDGMTMLEPRESDVVRNLKQLLDEVREGNVNNDLRFKEMQERIEVLEANTFVEAAKWIFEKICELLGIFKINID